MKKRRSIIVCIVGSLLIILGFTAFFAARWYISKYGDIGFASVLYTLLAGLGGTEEGLITDYLKSGLCPALVLSLVVCVFLFINFKRGIGVKRKNKDKLRLYPFPNAFSMIVSVVLSLVLLGFAGQEVGFFEWAASMADSTSLYDDEYVDPDKTEISFPEKKKNLIYIFLESMETSFMSYSLGGGEPYNLIPELYNLAEDNVNFSHNDGIGGWGLVSNTTWTASSMIAQTAGIPCTTPINGNKLGEYDSMFPGVTTIMDILHDNGYEQALMVGSVGSFAGRDKYYLQHGTDNVYDLTSAKNDGIVPRDYFVWWGMEDMYLFRYAQRKIQQMADSGKPFAFSMLTVDTHHIGGYKCELCGDEYPEQYENVIACSSRQVYQFIEWLRQQDFYDDTTIVICGDHRSMDKGYADRTFSSSYDRHIYNCIINSSVGTDNTKNRVFTPMDMFPTTLAAMGCSIDGDRLGLGTNLFSELQTVAERYGADELNSEIEKNSLYYITNFING